MYIIISLNINLQNSKSYSVKRLLADNNIFLINLINIEIKFKIIILFKIVLLFYFITLIYF